MTNESNESLLRRNDVPEIVGTRYNQGDLAGMSTRIPCEVLVYSCSYVPLRYLEIRTGTDDKRRTTSTVTSTRYEYCTNLYEYYLYKHELLY